MLSPSSVFLDLCLKDLNLTSFSDLYLLEIPSWLLWHEVSGWNNSYFAELIIISVIQVDMPSEQLECWDQNSLQNRVEDLGLLNARFYDLSHREFCFPFLLNSVDLDWWLPFYHARGAKIMTRHIPVQAMCMIIHTKGINFLCIFWIMCFYLLHYAVACLSMKKRMDFRGRS